MDLKEWNTLMKITQLESDKFELNQIHTGLIPQPQLLGMLLSCPLTDLVLWSIGFSYFFISTWRSHSLVQFKFIDFMINFLKWETPKGSREVGCRERNKEYQSLLHKNPGEKMGPNFGLGEAILSVISYLSGTYKNNSKCLWKESWSLQKLLKHLEQSSISLSQEKLYLKTTFQSKNVWRLWA